MADVGSICSVQAALQHYALLAMGISFDTLSRPFCVRLPKSDRYYSVKHVILELHWLN